MPSQESAGSPRAGSAENLAHKRHTLAHLTAAAVLTFWPDAKNTIGPAVDNGFYYDFEFATPITDKDLQKVEQKMREILKSWKGFSHKEVSEKEARAHFASNKYKLELIDEIVAKGEKITLYTAGDTSKDGGGPNAFTDLCRGGHSENPAKEIETGSYVLTHIAGAYWRGDEKNKMLTRIYGLAFDTKKELEDYRTQLEEAKKRDHRKIGKELGLFVFSDLVGPGLPLWTPKGTIIRELLNDYVWEMRKKHGYQKVTIPHITKKALYETSGHWKKYAEDLFKIKTREDHTYVMKPMNCPHHTQIFASSPKSYRDMPQRYCETTMVYRDEQSGELNGLSRVLSITQDDAHVFCRESQMEDEIFVIWDIIDHFYKTFGFKNLQVRFSRHDPAQFEKYMGTKEVWEKSESALKSLLARRGITPIDGKGEAAFYGPKLDFIAHDSIGRVLQVATIQLDFNMPKNFDLTCTNEKGEKEQIVMIHCAIMGSIERFMSTLIEHVNGNFPLWLAPTQIKIVPIGDAHHAYASEVHDELVKAAAAQDIELRIDLDLNDVGFGKKVRAAKNEKTPYMLVIGDKELEAKKVTVESRDRGQLGQHSVSDLAKILISEISEKKIA